MSTDAAIPNKLQAMYTGRPRALPMQRDRALFEILDGPLRSHGARKWATQLEDLARGEIERLVGEIDAANESVKLAQDELLAAQVISE